MPKQIEWPLCNECAKSAGGTPPQHMATYYVQQCIRCGVHEGMAAWSDWGWPRDKPKNRPEVSSNDGS
jgi:hypothetical protein